MTKSPIEIILFAHNFPPINSSGSQRPYRFWKYLPEHGVTAHVICSSSGGRIEEFQNVHYVPDGGGVPLWLKAQTAALTAVQRIIPHNERIPWVSSAVHRAGELIKKHPVRAVVSTFPPLATHLAGLWLKRRHPDLKWVADFRDNLVGNPFRKDQEGLKHERFMEPRIFRRANLLTTVTPGIEREWLERYPQYRHKIRVLWNGFDPEEDFPAAPLESRSRRVIAHVGNIYGLRHPQMLLETLDRLVENGRADPASFTVELTGPLTEPPQVKRAASFTRLIELGCLKLEGPVPRAEANRRIASCDTLLVIDLNELNVGHAAPAKLFDYIRARRPILGLVPRNSIVEEIVTRSGVPSVFLYPEDAPELRDEKVASFLARPVEPFEPDPWFYEHFDGRRQAAQLANWLTTL